MLYLKHNSHFHTFPKGPRQFRCGLLFFALKKQKVDLLLSEFIFYMLTIRNSGKSRYRVTCEHICLVWNVTLKESQQMNQLLFLLTRPMRDVTDTTIRKYYEI